MRLDGHTKHDMETCQKVGLKSWFLPSIVCSLASILLFCFKAGLRNEVFRLDSYLRHPDPERFQKVG
jgi:hypothetical protein